MHLLKILLLATATLAKQPNILFVLTDDQGKYVGGLEHMPKLQVRVSSDSTLSSKLTSKGNTRTTGNKLLQPLLLHRIMLSLPSEPVDRPHATQHQRHRRRPALRRLS